MKIEDVAKLLKGRLRGAEGVEITGVQDLAGAGPGDLSFVQSERHLGAARSSRAAGLLVPPGLEVPGKPCIEVPNPKFSFILLLSRFLPRPPARSGVHERAVVAADAQVGEGAWVGPGAVVESGAWLGPGSRVEAGAYVGPGARLGAGVVVHPNATLYGRVVVGDRAVIHAGSVIGADGFGYVQEGKGGQADAGGAIERYMQVEGPHVKVPQLGDVILGEDVEIGASVTVDRGTIGSTVVGSGTKIDNQVQIGHNCRIGEDVIIVAEVGIGGSVKVGNHVTIGGNCGISESCDIGDFCIVGAHTLMYPGKRFAPRTVIFGNPAREASKTKEQMLALGSLPRVVRRLQQLETRLAALEKGSPPRGDDSP